MPIYDLECMSCGKVLKNKRLDKYLSTGDKVTYDECSCGCRRFKRLGGEPPANRNSRWATECSPYYHRGRQSGSKS